MKSPQKEYYIKNLQYRFHEQPNLFKIKWILKISTNMRLLVLKQNELIFYCQICREKQPFIFYLFDESPFLNIWTSVVLVTVLEFKPSCAQTC